MHEQNRLVKCSECTKVWVIWDIKLGNLYIFTPLLHETSANKHIWTKWTTVQSTLCTTFCIILAAGSEIQANLRVKYIFFCHFWRSQGVYPGYTFGYPP